MAIKFTYTNLFDSYSNPIVGYKFNESTVVSATGQKIVNMTNEYSSGLNEIEVYLNGVMMQVNEDYIELSDTSIEFNYDLEKDDIVKIILREVKL